MSDLREIVTREFKTAGEFLERMRRSHPDWLPNGASRCPWIFRGQGEKPGRRLVPGAWRDTITEHVYQTILRGVSADNIARSREIYKLDAAIGDDRITEALARTQLEQRGVVEFIEFVNELGFPIPASPLHVQRRFHIWEVVNGMRSQHAALAQHHRIRTSLLDWTYNPMYAAFFAADRAEEDGCEQIAVWALNRGELERDRATSSKFGIHFLEGERSSIGYLHRQEGVFTYFEKGYFTYLHEGDWPTYEKCVPEFMCKCFLPAGEAENLLKLLAAERVTRAHLMPTHDNITDALNRMWKSGASIFSNE